MRDRTPTKALENGALRYGVYAEDGSLLRHEYLALEDDPADPGTELRKSTLLQDSTEVSLFGSAADRTVDEAFAGIAGQLKLIKSDMAAITLTVQDTNGKPIPDALVQGILSENGQAVYTDANGVATGYIGEGQQVVKVSGYADVEDYSETLTVVKGTNISKTWKLTTNNFLSVKSSRSVKFTGNVSTIDYSVTSGGGGGGAGYGYPGGGGGAGGGTITKTGVEISPNTVYPATVGAGGKGGTYRDYDGHPGGQSSLWEMPLLAEIPGYLRSGGAVVNPVASGEADLKAVEAAEMAAVILITAQTAAMLLQQRLPLLPKQNPLVAAALEEKAKIIAVPVRQMALSAVQPTLAEAAAVAMVLEKIKRVITMTVLALMVIPDSSASGCT